ASLATLTCFGIGLALLAESGRKAALATATGMEAGFYRYTSAHLMISVLLGSSRQCLASSCQRRCFFAAVFVASFAAGLAASCGAGFCSGAWAQAGAASTSASSRTVGFIRLPLFR